MIALTQEKREELKVFLSASIEQRCTVYTLTKQRELEELRDQIALASLNEEPFAFVSGDALSGDYDSRAVIYPVDVAASITKTGFKLIPLFTTPPVPEIKLPEKPDYSGNFTSFKDPVSAYKDGVVDGHRWYEMALKSLNGLGE